MHLHRILTGLTLCLIFLPAYANPFQHYPVSPPPMQQSPAGVLKQGIEQLTTYLAARGGQDSPPLEVFVEKTISPLFDFAYMTKWAAGPQYNYMNPQQGAAMEQKLRGHFLTTMVDTLAEYRHGRVKYLRPIGNPQTGEITLRLMAYQQGDPYPKRLSFRMYRSNHGWKVFDVSSNGQSALAFYRTQFALQARPQPSPYYRAYSGTDYPGRQFLPPRY
ncbi:MlaC/ttg2D family ABC transporter substrate-binding protein [Sulfuriflexus mobilis]|uniref:MlaC/ttg2D family ABC transporter substrate-binding protein n=1 Tax=Sulfuriflexus mobilis TaxID=1811807 RepID=UPI000F8272AF|nr:ABC transporter substrate-binding protein [Sulfuriflexus mobilis]